MMLVKGYVCRIFRVGNGSGVRSVGGLGSRHTTRLQQKEKMHGGPGGHSILVIRLAGGREAQSKHEGGKQGSGRWGLERRKKGGAKADSPRELEGLV